jgi:hypothetical protein
MKRVRIVAFCIIMIIGLVISIARSGPSESLQAFIEIARTAGATQGLTHSNSDGPKSLWCTNLADEYILNGDGNQNRFAEAALRPVTQAFYQACIKS